MLVLQGKIGSLVLTLFPSTRSWTAIRSNCGPRGCCDLLAVAGANLVKMLS